MKRRDSLSNNNHARRNSVVEERLSSATIRRLSWRRKAFQRNINPFEQLNETTTLNVNGNKQDNELKSRHLVPAGRTFSFHNDRTRLITKWLIKNKLFYEKQLQWSREINKRGKYGESLVHILIVNQTNESLIILILLLELWPSLLEDQFESLKFKGLTCLHLSIAYKNELLLEYLLEIFKLKQINKNLIDQRVHGSLFSSPIINRKVVEVEPSSTSNPLRKLLTCFKFRSKVGQIVVEENNNNLYSVENNIKIFENLKENNNNEKSFWCDKMEHWPTANGYLHLILFDRILASLLNNKQVMMTTTVNADDDGEINQSKDINQDTIYLGDTPLAWSVSFNSRSMFELLIKYGATKNSIDLNGNTCLHLIVINNQTGWCRFLVKSGCDLSKRNYLNQTPFLFACHLGRYKLFDEFLELSAVEFWSYSMVRCCGYPLTDLDSINFTNSTNTERTKNQSAMSVILESNVSGNEQKSRLLSSPVVKKLLSEKWRIYASKLFYNELLILLLQLFSMTIAISLRPMLHKPINSLSIEKIDKIYSLFSAPFWASLWPNRESLVS